MQFLEDLKGCKYNWVDTLTSIDSLCPLYRWYNDSVMNDPTSDVCVSNVCVCVQCMCVTIWAMSKKQISWDKYYIFSEIHSLHFFKFFQFIRKIFVNMRKASIIYTKYNKQSKWKWKQNENPSKWFCKEKRIRELLFFSISLKSISFSIHSFGSGNHNSTTNLSEKTQTKLFIKRRKK